jgi:hypothetical protein
MVFSAVILLKIQTMDTESYDTKNHVLTAEQLKTVVRAPFIHPPM